MGGGRIFLFWVLFSFLQGWGLNPGPGACYPSTLPLSYISSPRNSYLKRILSMKIKVNEKMAQVILLPTVPLGTATSVWLKNWRLNVTKLHFNLYLKADNRFHEQPFKYIWNHLRIWIYSGNHRDCELGIQIGVANAFFFFFLHWSQDGP
jgi:hypothetical protein